MSEAEIISVLRSFFVEMGHWELECRKRFKQSKRGEIPHDQARDDSIAALKQIFTRFCTNSETPARARKGSIHFSTIPTYGENLERILKVEMGADEVKVTTQQTTGLKDQFVYRLVRQGSEWRIKDDRKRIDTNGEEVDWDL